MKASKAHIWELEKGDSRNPSIELLQRLAQHFDVSIAYVVGEDPDAPDEEKELVAMFRELKDLDADRPRYAQHYHEENAPAQTEGQPK